MKATNTPLHGHTGMAELGRGGFSPANFKQKIHKIIILQRSPTPYKLAPVAHACYPPTPHPEFKIPSAIPDIHSNLAFSFYIVQYDV